MRFDQLDVLQAYDGVWASACLLHVPKEELSGILARIHHAFEAAGDRRLLALETSEIKSFDETPATMLHLVVRRS